VKVALIVQVSPAGIPPLQLFVEPNWALVDVMVTV